MSEDNKDKAGIIEKILSVELEMFLNVPSAGKSSCQEYPESFKTHRRAHFFPWSKDTLESYLQDLRTALASGTNLMTLKYARMDNLIPPLNTNPLIGKIVEIQCAWQRDVLLKYPGIMGGGRPLSSADDSSSMTSFETYLRGEIETYSDTTLKLLYRDMLHKQAQGISMSREVYEYLVREKGYSSMEDAEKQIQAKTKRGS
jgi:hypothetical protein